MTTRQINRRETRFESRMPETIRARVSCLRPSTFGLRLPLAMLLLATFNPQLSTAFAQGTAFTYQGRLTANGSPANGLYSFQFLLRQTSNGAQQGPTLTNNAVAVSNGLFTTTLDFGDYFGEREFALEIGVRTNGSALPFTILAPTQVIRPTPLAIAANHAASAGTVGQVPDGALSANIPRLDGPAAFTGPVSFSNATGIFSGNGAGLTNLNANTLEGLGAGSFWLVGGNGNVANPVLGSSSAQPLQFIAGNRRVLQLETTSVSLGGFDSVIAVNTLGGVFRNIISNGVLGGTISGGGAVTNHLFSAEAAPNQVLDNYGTVGGGINNTAGYASTDLDDGRAATVAGGQENTAGGFAATVGGGWGNMASFSGTVSGGVFNTNSASLGTIGGGYWNISSGDSATVPGGLYNVAAGIGSFAAGQYAQALHDGCFVWNAPEDFTGTPAQSTGSNQFVIRASGGVQLATNTSLHFGSQTRQMVNLYGSSYGLGIQAGTMYFRCDTGPGEPLAGFRWYKGGAHSDALGNAGGGTEMMSLTELGLYVRGSFVSSSDRNVKAGFTPVDPKAILEKVVALPIQRWHFTNNASTPHLGPMAQDFYAAFGLGTDDKHIATVDADGVALAAIQGLNEKVETRSRKSEDRIQKLEAENLELRRELEALKRAIGSLANSMNGGLQ